MTTTQWIDVTDKLPSENDGTVAVLLDSGEILTAWATYWHGSCNRFAQWTFPHNDEEDDVVVTHWCKLPSLP